MPYLIILMAGFSSGIQAPLNSLLKKGVGNVWLSGLIIAVSQSLLFLILFAFDSGDIPSRAQIMDLPWYAYFSAAFGCIVLYASFSQTQEVGVGVFNSVLVTAAILLSLAIDHFSWLGVERHPISFGRAAGAILMIAGVLLIGVF